MIKTQLITTIRLHKIIRATLGLLLLFTIPVSSYSQAIIAGWVEMVNIGKPGIQMLAKLDTGADHSSINVTKSRLYYKKGQLWVKFKVVNSKGRSISLDKKVVRFARIKKKTDGLQRRIVINMHLCIGQVPKLVQVNLVDRSHFRYQLLIGRSALKNHFLIDSYRKHLTTPMCVK